MPRICPTHKIECHLYFCDSTDTCKHEGVNSAAATYMADANPLTGIECEPPAGITCARQNGKCNRWDCERAEYCRNSYAKAFTAGVSLTKTQAENAYSAIGSNSTATANQPRSYTPSCHSGWNYVGAIGSVYVCLGRASTLTEDRIAKDRAPIILAIDCQDRGSIPNIGNFTVRHNPEAASLAKGLVQSYGIVPTLEIAWPDFGVPDLDKAWWQTLVDNLAAHPGGDLVIYCMGGHGRTGTAAAILSVLGGFLPDTEPCPVTWLRRVYCSEIVESSEQIEYIEDMTGVKVLAKPRYFYSTFSGAHGNYDLWADALDKAAKGKPSVSPLARPPKLSNNRYRRLVKECAREGVVLTPFKGLQDGEELDWGTFIYAWNSTLHAWEFVEDTEPEPDPDPADAARPSPTPETVAATVPSEGEGEKKTLSNVEYLRLRLKHLAQFPGDAPFFPRMADLSNGRKCSLDGQVYEWRGSAWVWIGISTLPSGGLKVWSLDR